MIISEILCNPVVEKSNSCSSKQEYLIPSHKTTATIGWTVGDPNEYFIEFDSCPSFRLIFSAFKNAYSRNSLQFRSSTI